MNSIDDTGKDTRLARLKKLEVFTAEQILERHTIQYQNKDVGGKVSRAGATVMLEEDKLEIYMTELYFENDRTLDWLVTSLGWALGMDPTKNSLQLHMLYYVLVLEDHSEIARLLDKYGIPKNLNADDDDYDWNFQGQYGEGMPNDGGFGAGKDPVAPAPEPAVSHSWLFQVPTLITMLISLPRVRTQGAG